MGNGIEQAPGASSGQPENKALVPKPGSEPPEPLPPDKGLTEIKKDEVSPTGPSGEPLSAATAAAAFEKAADKIAKEKRRREPTKPKKAVESFLPTEIKKGGPPKAPSHSPPKPAPLEKISPPSEITSPAAEVKKEKPGPLVVPKITARHIQIVRFSKKREKKPLPKIHIYRQRDTQQEQKPKKEEKQSAKPVVDVPLPLALSFILDPKQPIDSPVNQNRLEFVRLYVSGALGKPANFRELLDQGDVLVGISSDITLSRLPEYIEWIRRELAQNTLISAINIETLVKHPEKVPEGTNPEFLRSCSAVFENLSTIINRIDGAKTEFEYPPTLLPQMIPQEDRDVLEHPTFIRAMGYLASHMGFVSFTDEKERHEYAQHIAESKDHPVLYQIRSILGDYPFGKRYKGSKNLLPPGYTDKQLADKLHSWTRGFPPKPIIEAIMADSRPVFAAFGLTTPDIDYGKLDLSLLSSATISEKETENINRLFREMQTRASILVNFYSAGYPLSLFYYTKENPQEDPRHLPSSFTAWMRKEGVRFTFLTEEPSADTVRHIHAFEPGEPIDCVYQIVSVINMFENFDHALTLDYLEDHPVFTLTKVIEPSYSPETIAQYPSIYERLIQGLIKKGFLIPSKGKGAKNVWNLAPHTPAYVSVIQLARLVGLEDDTRIQKFASVLQEITSDRYLSYQAERFILLDKLKTAESKIFQRKEAWLIPLGLSTLNEQGEILDSDGIIRSMELGRTNQIGGRLATLYENMNTYTGYVRNYLRKSQLGNYISQCTEVAEYNNLSAESKLDELEWQKRQLLISVESLPDEINQIKKLMQGFDQGRDWGDVVKEWDALTSESPRNEQEEQVRRRYMIWRQRLDLVSAKQRELDSVNTQIRRLQEEQSQPVQGKPYPIPPVEDTVKYWVRPYVASTIMHILRESQDRVLDITDREQLASYSLGVNEHGQSVVTARSKVMVKLLDVLRSLDEEVAKKSEWSAIDKLLQDTELALKEYEDSMLQPAESDAQVVGAEFLLEQVAPSWVVDSSYKIPQAKKSLEEEEEITEEPSVARPASPEEWMKLFGAYNIGDLEGLIETLQTDMKKDAQFWETPAGKIKRSFFEKVLGRTIEALDYESLIKFLENIIQIKKLKNV